MSQWNTTIKFCSIPEFLIGNGSQIEFETKEEQEQFFSAHAVEELSYDNMSYMRSTAGIARIAYNKDRLDALAPNWIMFKNEDFGDKWYYANISETYYVSPNVTEVSYATDSFQTFMFDLDRTKESYVMRRTWSGSMDDENELMQLPYEDLDIGSDYVICDTTFDFNDSQGNYETEVFYYILLTEKITSSGSSHNILTGEHSQSYLQGNETKTINYSNGQNSVLYGYVINYRLLNSLLNQGVFASDCKIVNALQLIMQLPFGRSMFGSMTNIASEINISTTITIPDGSELYDQQYFGYMTHTVEIPNWSDRLCDYINKCVSGNFESAFNANVPDSAIGKYLFRYPYALLETYDFYNQPDNVQIDALNKINQFESIRNKLLSVYKYASIGQNPMLVYTVKGNKNTGSDQAWNNKNTGDNIYAMTSANMNTIQASISLPIISDYLASFLQANMNQINAQRANLKDSLSTQIANAGSTLQAQATSIALSQRNALISARTQAANARMQTQASLSAQLASINSSRITQERSTQTELANATRANVMTGASALVSGVAGIATGSPMMTVGGTIGLLAAASNQTSAQATALTSRRNIATTATTNENNATLLAAANNAQTANTLKAATDIAANAAAASQAVANAAYGNALRSASTAYNNEIRTINARLEDAKNVPDSVQSMGNNASIFNNMFNRDIIRFSTKSLPRTVMKRLVDYFVTNGFLTNQLDTLANIKSKFEDDPGYFVQTINCNVAGKIPPEHLQNIKDMYDGGIYLWKKNHYLDYAGMREV